jgi:glycosyltransferase involved in cell wall biosynthesis
MIGTALQGRGGMSSVVATYQQQGLFEAAHVHYLEVHREVSGLQKALLVLHGLWALLGLLVRGEVGLLHIHTASGVSFWRKSLFATLGRLFGRPVLMHVHGGEFVEFYARTPALGRWWIRWVLEGAARVLVLSDTWQQRMQKVSGRLHTEALANPVVLPPQGTLVEQPETGVHFVFLGRLERDKGVFEAVEAFAQLVAQHPDARLTLAGEGDMAGVKAHAQARGVADKVHFPGWVSGDAKNQLLAQAHVFVLPSYIEGLPVSMLEAMAYGLPVVVSRVGSVPEVLTEGQTGMMVEAKSTASLHTALAALAASRELRCRIGRAGWDLVVERYSAQTVCQRLLSIYAQVSPEGDTHVHR